MKKDVVQIFGVVLFVCVIGWFGFQLVMDEMATQERFTRECIARGGTPINEHSGTRTCVAGQEIKIPGVK